MSWQQRPSTSTKNGRGYSNDDMFACTFSLSVIWLSSFHQFQAQKFCWRPFRFGWALHVRVWRIWMLTACGSGACICIRFDGVYASQHTTRSPSASAHNSCTIRSKGIHFFHSQIFKQLPWCAVAAFQLYFCAVSNWIYDSKWNSK